MKAIVMGLVLAVVVGCATVSDKYPAQAKVVPYVQHDKDLD